jgi:hypothetical protein
MPIFGGLLSLGAPLIGGLIKSRGAKKAGKAAAAAAEQGQRNVIENTGLRAASTGGAQARQQALDLLGVRREGAAPGDLTASQQAFQDFQSSTGYGAQRDAGNDAINANAAARGMLNSGATLKATQRFGAGLGQQYFTNYINQLMGAADRGAAADATLAGVYTGTADRVGSARAGGIQGSTDAIGSAIGDAAQNVAGMYGLGMFGRKPRAEQPLQDPFVSPVPQGRTPILTPPPVDYKAALGTLPQPRLRPSTNFLGG